MSQDEFWDRIASVNAGLLDASAGVRSVPMSHYPDRTANALWFITAKGTDLVDEVDGGPRDAAYRVSDGGKGLYAELHGSLSLSQDRAKLDKIWSPVAGAWFEDGKDDADIRLLCFTIAKGEVWATPTSGLTFMLGIARAQLMGSPPDMGSHFMLHPQESVAS